MFVDASFGPYYGVSGATSMYNPKVDKGQSSEGYLYVKNGEGDGTNMIVIGWNVSFNLFYYVNFLLSKICIYQLIYILNKFGVIFPIYMMLGISRFVQ